MFACLLVSNRYCHYNGRFTIQGNLGYYGETKTCTPLVVWQGKTAFASVAAQGNTGSQSKNVWIIKSDPKRDRNWGLEVLITPSSSKGGYLTPTTAKTYDEWGDPDTSSGVKMQLKKRKHYFIFYAGEGSDETTAPDEVDCLQIDLTTRQKGGDSSIAYDYSNCANQRGRVKFVFSDPDASNWLLTPV